MKEKTNLEMLVWGLNHIAENHGISASTDYEDGNVCVYGKCTVPVLADVQMLCDDIEIDRDCIYPSDCGVDIDITFEWLESKGKDKYVGLNFWRRSM